MRAATILGLGLHVLIFNSGCADLHRATAPCISIPGTGLPLIPAGVVSRSISWENRTGEAGAGGKEAAGRKGSPAIPLIRNGETVTLMDVDGCGVIRHVWLTLPNRDPAGLRNVILRMYWDNHAVPSVEVPLGDFFGVAHGRPCELATAFVTIGLGRGFNSYFPMPFRKHARITVENDLPDGKDVKLFFFQIDYDLCASLPANTGYFHAQFRRENPTVEQRDFVVLDGAEGPGMFVGCVIGVRALAPEWWGEGEMKFYLDDDEAYPTICGTGTEDYFGGAWGMGTFQTPWSGCTLNLTNEFFVQPLVSMYRFHEKDPIVFRKNLKATIQQIGWRREGLYERSDDWCSVAYWYQLRPAAHMPPLPDRAARTAGIIELPKPAE